MIELDITREMRDNAQIRADDMPKLNNSVTNQTGVLFGFVGEEMVASLSPTFNIIGADAGVYNYDIKSEDGLKIEVKTKRAKYKPRTNWDVSIYELNTTQKCDIYIFTRVLLDFTKGWILGIMPHDEYFDKSRFLAKGTVDGSNRFKIASDCWNLRIDELYQL